MGSTSFPGSFISRPPPPWDEKVTDFTMLYMRHIFGLDDVRYRSLFCLIGLWIGYRTLPFHYQEWIISNLPCSLNRNITAHSMKNLTFHSLLRWNMIIPTNSHYLTYTFLYKKLRECTFEFGSERVKFGVKLRIFSQHARQELQTTWTDCCWQAAHCL